MLATRLCAAALNSQTELYNNRFRQYFYPVPVVPSPIDYQWWMAGATLSVKSLLRQ